MTRMAHFSTILVASVLFQFATGQENYDVHPDSIPQDGVPKGEIEGPFEWKSDIFPGTVRDYWLYVPAQYEKQKAACTIIVQDGLNRAKNWKLIDSMDNLIHKKEMPVTIGIFINPGVVPAPHENAQARFNRSFEYDALGDRYARFLLEEIIPEVEKKYNLSDDPNDRAIAGASSGAICAFTAAWERPDAFRRVLSTIGTYVGLRGGDVYPVLIRKMEPKPIRVFLQDGKTDLDLYGGSWWHANLNMLSAFQFAGYDVKHAWGEGGHNGKHAAAIMPDILRWLWRDHPEPIVAGRAKQRRTDILIPGQDWQLVSEGHRFTEGPAVNAQGEIFFTDIPADRIHKIDQDGNVSVFAENTNKANGLMFAADGSLYACQNEVKQIVKYDASGKATTVLQNAPCNDLILFENGGYYTDPTNHKVWHFDFDGKRMLVDEGIGFPNGVIASPDRSLLIVSDTHGRFLHSYQIQPDGKLLYKQPYGHLHLTDDNAQSGADGMTVDDQGRIYVTTRLGVQVMDQLGRCHFIIRKPSDGWLSNVVFGGPKLDTLYATCGDKVFKRKLNAKGVVSWKTETKPPRPRL